MVTARFTLALVALAAASSAAFAQTPCTPGIPTAPCPPNPSNCLTNPSFECIDVFTTSRDPVGWHNLSNPLESKRRQLGDGLTPTAVARTGEASIAIGTPGQSQFRGMTSDWINYDEIGLPFYDPYFDYNGGDVIVTGWYYIPTTDPIIGDMAFIKLNVKRGNQDFAAFDAAAEGPDNLRIQGDTNNQWRYYELRWPIADIHEECEFNQAQGYFTMPPYPNHLKITIGRFGFGSVESSGTIFWDDMSFTQESAPPLCPTCAADFNNDGGVDGSDVEAFFTAWESGDSCGDVNLDGGVDGADVEAFYTLWEAGGC